ncbi:MAG: ATP-binding protein [Christensenellaceae bacterium]|nr:ATP-binding protein [Christensenellaceae bacterium]
MRSEILRELLAEYEEQRREDTREEDRRLAEVTAKCPEIPELMRAREGLIYGGMRSILAGTQASDDLPQRMEVMNRRIASLLEQNGWSADYLDPVYRCKVCRDTGYAGEPIRETCPCLKGRFYERLYKAIGLGEDSSQSFDSFRLDIFPDKKLEGRAFSQRDMMRMIRKVCEDWADAFPKAETRDMLLMGQSGLGKTFLMRSMAKRLVERGYQVLMVSAYRFLEVARKAYFGQGAEELENIIGADVLFIDDMGVEPLMENITIPQWYNLINERQTRGRGTVISTNLMEEDLRKRYTERIASRLMDPRQCRLVQFAGEDVRRRAE